MTDGCLTACRDIPIGKRDERSSLGSIEARKGDGVRIRAGGVEVFKYSIDLLKLLSDCAKETFQATYIYAYQQDDHA